MIKGKFLVPNYYSSFSCKGGQCNNVCCSLWTITLTQDEYFKIQSLDVSKNLKDKIETYIGILPSPTNERYARINLDYNGICPLRLENGYCALQCEVGESNIPSVCRYYPRSPHLFPRKECVISSSCERTIELLINDPNSFSLVEEDLSFYFDDDEDKEKENVQNIEFRDKMLQIISNRNINILERIRSILNLTNNNFKEDAEIINKIYQKIKSVYSRSFSINEYLNERDRLLPLNEAYKLAKDKYNDLDIWLEKIIANHLYYVKYPFVSSIDYKDAAYGLYFVILLSLNLTISYCKNNKKEEFISLICNSFRVYEHSAFYYNIAYLYDRINDLESM